MVVIALETRAGQMRAPADSRSLTTCLTEITLFSGSGSVKAMATQPTHPSKLASI